MNFNLTEKNTLITTDPDVDHNKPKDLEKILDIRLYPVLRNLIKGNRMELFLGTINEMIAYYRSKNAVILFEFTIPSSATYYLAKRGEDDLFVIMAGLVGRENLIAQLITLKLAGISLDNIEIIGEITHFKVLFNNDFNSAIKKFPTLQTKAHVLIVAGCRLEGMVSQVVKDELGEKLETSEQFKGNIISFVYDLLSNGTIGIITLNLNLNLNYGEITEEVVKLFLENCNCSHVFIEGAAGYLSTLFPIGTRITISKARNVEGEIVQVEPWFKDDNISPMHLHVPTIFIETYNWLKEAKEYRTSVDIETFYILRAIQNHKIKIKIKIKIKADCGLFISDHVGEKSLREYSNVFKEYSHVLTRFLRRILI